MPSADTDRIMNSLNELKQTVNDIDKKNEHRFTALETKIDNYNGYGKQVQKNKTEIAVLGSRLDRTQVGSGIGGIIAGLVAWWLKQSH